jgi:hypothetical protein
MKKLENLKNLITDKNMRTELLFISILYILIFSIIFLFMNLFYSLLIIAAFLLSNLYLVELFSSQDTHEKFNSNLTSRNLELSLENEKLKQHNNSQAEIIIQLLKNNKKE